MKFIYKVTKMNPVPRNNAKKTVFRRDGVKRVINRDEITMKELNAFYRESNPLSSSDSEDGSRGNSVSNNSDYQTPAENTQGNHCGLNNLRDEIAERLSRIEIGYNKNAKNDSGMVHDPTSENDSEQPSIIAGNIPNNMNSLPSIHSVADSRFSIILAGRLDSKDDLYAHMDEHSLLNVAINEADETNEGENQCSIELSHFIDSLEVSTNEVSSCGLNEKDSSEADAYCPVKKSGNRKERNDLLDNDENSDPNIVESRRLIKPRIISNESVQYQMKTTKNPAQKVLAAVEEDHFLKPALKPKNDILEENSNFTERTERRFHSTLSESERLVVADIETPCRKGTCFIEECCKSTPRIEVNVDTFGSELISNISNLSAFGNENFEQNVKKVEADSCRDGIVRRISQQFVQEPIKFTERLITLLEESVLAHDKPEDSYPSGVNLSQLTEALRKMCGNGIEDQSMPEFAPSFNVSTPPNVTAGNNTCNNTAATSYQDFIRLGGGTKVYPKTPRRVLKASTGIHCKTPNCTNVLHKAKNNNLYSPGHGKLAGIHDDTQTFEFWEGLCYDMSPTKPTPPNKRIRPRFLADQIAGIFTQEDLIRKSDQQMAVLGQGSPVEMETEEEEEFDHGGKNLPKPRKDFQDQSDCKAEKFIEHLSTSLAKGKGNDKVRDPTQEHNCSEINQNLVPLIEKRRRCFEEARRVFDNQQSNSLAKCSKSGAMGKLEDRARFVNTISACVDYFEHVQALRSHKKSLQCILERSEDSDSLRDNTEHSRPTEFVEALILPPHNRRKYRIDGPELSPKKTNLIAQTCLYIPGTPKISKEKSSSKSPNRRAYLSPRKLSPRPQSPNVVSKKIKSPVSPARGKSLRAAKPASHATLPRTPSITPEFHASRSKQSSVSCRSGINSTPRCAAHSIKSATNPPSLDVTNIKKKNEIPKVIITNPSPSSKSQKRSARLKGFSNDMDLNCQTQLEFSDPDTPPVRQKRFFYTPGKTPVCVKEKPKKKYFQTPKMEPLRKKLPGNSPGSCRINYNTVESPIRSYIQGTNPHLITNVRGKTNERLLTPRSTTPKSKSKVSSPILSRSPCRSPQPTESARLKFQLTPSRRQEQKQKDVLNIALCESDPSLNIGSESTSHSPFPKIFYKPAPCVKMIKDNKSQSRSPKVLIRGAEEKFIYRHEGRLKSATESKAASLPADGSTKDSFSCDSGDISLLHQRPVAKTNYLPKK